MKARTLKKWSILLLAALLLPACGNRQGQDLGTTPQGELTLQVTQEADKESTAAPSKEPQAGDVTTEAGPRTFFHRLPLRARTVRMARTAKTAKTA